MGQTSRERMTTAPSFSRDLTVRGQYDPTDVRPLAHITIYPQGMAYEDAEPIDDDPAAVGVGTMPGSWGTLYAAGRRL